MKLIWSPESRIDLRDIYRYIVQDNPQAARRVRDKILYSVSLLLEVPGIVRPGRIVNTRELSISGTPYIVLYRIKHGVIDIIRAYHAARLWPEEL